VNVRADGRGRHPLLACHLHRLREPAFQVVVHTGEVGEQFGFGLADVLGNAVIAFIAWLPARDLGEKFRGKADCSAPALDAEHGTVTGERLAWLA
jgi:hypothetical protein